MADWKPRVRRINTADVGEQGKLAFISSLIDEQRFDEAEDELKSLLAVNPRSYQANIQMGRLLARKKEFDRAVQHFETARLANPTNAQASLLAGTAYLRSGNAERAGNSFRAALRIDGSLAAGHAGLGQVHFQRNELPEAEACLQKALGLDPQLYQARALLARIHGKQGDLEASKDMITEIVSTRPDQPRPVAALARVHLQRDEPREAIFVVEPAVTAHPESQELWAILGRAKAAIEDYAGAEQALRKASELAPKERLIQVQLLRALIPQGKVQEALELLDRLPERARRNPRVHAAYGEVHMAGGNYKQASEFFRAALLHRPDGEATVKKIEDELTGEDTDWKVVAARYNAALEELRAEASLEQESDEKGDSEARARGKRRQKRLARAS